MSSDPPDPRSPRSPPSDVPAVTAESASGVAGGGQAPFVTQTTFLDTQGPQQRPNIGSILFLTAFFFFMSSTNNQPQMVIVGPDGQIQPRVTELDRARTQVEEYRGLLNGTVSGNWTESPRPAVLPSELLPTTYRHSGATPGRYFTNVTGFHRDGVGHAVNLVQPRSAPPKGDLGFFLGVPLPNLNSTHSGFNQSLATELQSGWDWSKVDKWEMNVKERSILPSRSNLTGGIDDEDWSWVRGTATFHAKTLEAALSMSSVDYSFLGLHYLPNGTYELYGVPDGQYLDIRDIPRLYPAHQKETRRIIMRELELELQTQERSLLLTDVRVDDNPRTRCPLLLHLSLPLIPEGIDFNDVERYEDELRNPAGLRASLRKPPEYWQGGGMGGVIIADQCGSAIGLDGGQGMRLEDFWRKTCNYAAYATVSLLLVLYLLVRQMEITRTPSTLAQVSLWSIVLMIAADSFVFSAHVAVGTVSDNKTSLPLLVPGFLSLCTAIVFGPRYAVLLYRVQAPERTADVVIEPTQIFSPATLESAEAGGVDPSSASLTRGAWERINRTIDSYPRLKVVAIGLTTFIIFQLIMVPSIAPMIMVALYSFWIPQIWRNATRNAVGVDKTFIIGTSLGRVAIPLYALGCPENVFFFEGSSAVWGLMLWQAVQVFILLAQERLGPAFFLPKRWAAAEGYNYHPLLDVVATGLRGGDSKIKPDAKGLIQDERTCSICMEEVDIHPATSSASADAILHGLSAGVAAWGGGGRPRRTYALAPCGHLFHTACLAQWLAVKSICPLCKRSLPPL